MPQDLILITERAVSLEELGRRIHASCPDLDTAEVLPGRLVASSSEQYVAIEDEPDLANSYGREELCLFGARLSAPRFYGVEFHDVDLLRRVLRAMLGAEAAFIDDDHGKIVPIWDFLSRPLS